MFKEMHVLRIHFLERNLLYECKDLCICIYKDLYKYIHILRIERKII